MKITAKSNSLFIKAAKHLAKSFIKSGRAFDFRTGSIESGDIKVEPDFEGRDRAWLILDGERHQFYDMDIFKGRMHWYAHIKKS